MAAAGFGTLIRNSGHLRKWLILGVIIGVIAGLGAVVFYLMLKYTTDLLLGHLVIIRCRPRSGTAAVRDPPVSGAPGPSRW